MGRGRESYREREGSPRSELASTKLSGGLTWPGQNGLTLAHLRFCSLCRVRNNWTKKKQALKSREDGLELNVVSHRSFLETLNPALFWGL